MAKQNISKEKGYNATVKQVFNKKLNPIHSSKMGVYRRSYVTVHYRFCGAAPRFYRILVFRLPAGRIRYGYRGIGFGWERIFGGLI